MRNVLLSLLLIAAVSIFPASLSAATLYRLTDLGTLPGSTLGTLAHGINSLGHVVGEANTNAIYEGVQRNVAHAFIWTPETGIQDLGPGGGANSIAYDINDFGQIVGGYRNYDYSNSPTGRPTDQHSAIWTAPNIFQTLSRLPGHDATEAKRINNLGQVVGTSFLDSDNSSDRPAIWDNTGAVQYIGDLPGGNSEGSAFGINDNGQVVGTSSGSSGNGFLWTSGTGIQGLSTKVPGGQGFLPLAINNSGNMLGHAVSLNADRGFLRWASDGSVQDLGSLAGYTTILPGGINSKNEVVGRVFNFAPGNNSRGFVWTPGEGLKDLNTLLDTSGAGWLIRYADDINDAGQIVGFGIAPNGAARGYLLTPVPEPSISLLAYLGILFGPLYRRRRS